MRWTVQIVVLVALAAFCLLQIPRKAWFFTPRAEARPGVPGAAFVELDEVHYRQMLRQAHELGWSRQTHTWIDEQGGSADARALDNVLPPPDPLPLPRVFTRVVPPLEPMRSALPLPALRPASLAAPPLVSLPDPAVAPAVSAPADDILDLNSYESLQERK